MNFSSSAIDMSNLFNDQKTYSVPLFQRSYSWKNEQIEELYSDIISYAENKEDTEYFIGTMVFSPHPDKLKVTILDGQQRFASIFLFLAALRDSISNSLLAHKDEWVEDINKILFKRATPNIEKKAKLELNKEDKSFFEEIIMNGIAPKPEKHSHYLMKSNHEFLKDKTTNGLDALGDSYIRNILDVIFNKLFIIRIDVNDEVNANLLFETLNDRGLELSAADLIKNYLFSLAGTNFDIVNTNWDRMSDQIGDNNISKFLRHYWISTYDFVKKEQLYKRIKQKITKNKVKNFSISIYNESIAYSNLINPTAEYWEEGETVKLLNDLKILRVEQVYILLLAITQGIFEKRDKLKKIIKNLTNFTFRYNTVAGLDPKVLENLYGNLSVNYRNNKITLSNIIEEIKKKSPSAEIFKASFDEFQTRNGKLAKYILNNINQSLLEQSNEKELTGNVENINLEHIIPKNPNKDWNDFLKSEGIKLKDVLYRLANQTILLKEYNKKISNSSFDKKVVVYKQSKLPINIKLMRLKKFGKREIERRQEYFANMANEIWAVK